MIIKPKFCKHGHDKRIVGQNKVGSCYECLRIMDKKRYALNRKGRRTNMNKRSKIYYIDNKKLFKNYAWKKQGILNEDGSVFTLVDYDRLYQIQQGRCKICKKHTVDLARNFDVDHNHQTGIVRSLLCPPCNTGLGIYEQRQSDFKKYLKTMEDK